MGELSGTVRSGFGNKGGRPRRVGVPLRHVTIQVEPSEHDDLRTLSKAYGMSYGGIVGKLVKRAKRKLDAKIAERNKAA